MSNSEIMTKYDANSITKDLMQIIKQNLSLADFDIKENIGLIDRMQFQLIMYLQQYDITKFNE